MSYSKALKHWHNHRKDRFYQQCGFTFQDNGIKSYAAIAEETAASYYVFDCATELKLTKNIIEWDDAVKAYYSLLPSYPKIKIYTDKGMVIAQ